MNIFDRIHMYVNPYWRPKPKKEKTSELPSVFQTNLRSFIEIIGFVAISYALIRLDVFLFHTQPIIKFVVGLALMPLSLLIYVIVEEIYNWFFPEPTREEWAVIRKEREKAKEDDK